MLALKIARSALVSATMAKYGTASSSLRGGGCTVVPLVSATMAKYGTASSSLRGGGYTVATSCGTSFLQKMTVERNFIISTTVTPFAVTVTRYYSSTPSSSSNHPKSDSVPSPPSLPDKQQLEKYFFRTVAFIWDICYWLVIWSRKNFDEHVVKNPSVQQYWKEFHEKMAKSKKD